MRRMLLSLIASVALVPVSAIAQVQNHSPSTTKGSASGQSETSFYSGVKILTYAEFVAQLRQAIAAEGLDLGAYKEDIAVISNMASKCPPMMPMITPLNSVRDISLRSSERNKYNNSPASRACESTSLIITRDANIPNPIVSGSEPRKLYV